MKKLLFILTVALVSGFSKSYAQTKFVATLTHGDQIKTYYGAGAFESAHNAAKSGDIITLSGGSFTGFTITKAVTVRGAGIDDGSTRISSSMSINIPESDTCRFSIEGVRFAKDYSLYLYGSCSEPHFIKCKFGYLNFYDNNDYNASAIKDAMFVNCRIDQGLNMRGSTTAMFSHCYVYEYVNYESYSSKAQFINCIVRGYLHNFCRSTFVNSIIWGCGISNYGLPSLPAETVAMNCTAFNFYGGAYLNSNIYSKMQGSQVDCTTSETEELFKNTDTFELNDEAKAKFLGTDGTEIGLYGGQYPYNTIPAYPRITKLNVAKQSTADDKLSVEIEVSAAE